MSPGRKCEPLWFYCARVDRLWTGGGQDVDCVVLWTSSQVILTVYLNDTQQMLTEVPITPATRVTDVVEYCKEAGEGDCHLAEVWNGHGESVGGNRASTASQPE